MKATTEALDGDLVMANPGGSAKLIYPDGASSKSSLAM